MSSNQDCIKLLTCVQSYIRTCIRELKATEAGPECSASKSQASPQRIARNASDDQASSASATTNTDVHPAAVGSFYCCGKRLRKEARKYHLTSKRHLARHPHEDRA